MYQTYTTDALVCGTYDRLTSDRSYRLFTRDLGMIWATARSVRLAKSRQRMALADFTLVRVSLVRGRGGWKIGSITPSKNYYYQALDQAARSGVVALVRSLRRFAAAEETQVDLFEFVIEVLEVTVTVVADRKWFTLVVSLQLLNKLGYVSSELMPEVAAAAPATLARPPRPDQTNFMPHLEKHLADAIVASQL